MKTLLERILFDYRETRDLRPSTVKLIEDAVAGSKTRKLYDIDEVEVEVLRRQTAKPECPYCGTTEGLRITGDGGLSAFGFQLLPTEYTCEDCFTGTDDGPSFDDLPEA